MSQPQPLRYAYHLSDEQFQEAQKQASGTKLGCSVAGIILALLVGWGLYSFWFPTTDTVNLVAGVLITVGLPLLILRLSLVAADSGARGVRRDHELILSAENLTYNDQVIAWHKIEKAILVKGATLQLKVKVPHPQKGEALTTLVIFGMDKFGDKDAILREMSARHHVPIEGWTANS